MTVASGEINLQSKHDRTHVAKVKAAMSAIPYSLRIQRFDKTKRKYILRTLRKQYP